MNINLDSMRDEILRYLAGQDLAVFHAQTRAMDGGAAVLWDSRGYPDYRMFLETAVKCGAKLIVFHSTEFTAEQLEDAFEQLEEAELPLEEEQGLRRRLRDLKSYEGFTCRLELSYDCQGNTYMYLLQADWYEDYAEMMEEIDAGLGLDGDDDEEDPMGGYFSRN